MMDFSPQSKIWIYQSNRKFSVAETNVIQNQLNTFVAQWDAHGQKLKARVEIFYHFFIVFTVDESLVKASGCSIDAMVHLLKDIEIAYGVDLFNRFNIAYKMGDEVLVCSKENFETLISIGKINSQTIVFNNTVQYLHDFETKWETSFANSWHQNIFGSLLR